MDDLNLIVEAERDWQTALQITTRCNHVNLFIGPPSSGKSTVLKHLLGDLTKLASVSTDGKFSIIENGDCLAHLDTYSTSNIHTIITKGDNVFVKCPDLSNINLVTAFFLERLLRTTRSIRIVFVCDYKTVTDNKHDYKVLWSSLLPMTQLMTNVDTIKNVGLIVTKTCGYSEDQAILKCLQNAFLQTVRVNCSSTFMANLDSDTKKIYLKTMNVIGCFEPRRIVLFKTPVQTGPLNESCLFSNNKIQAMFENIDRSDTNDLSFAFRVNSLKRNELRAIAERCHYAILRSLDNRINRFHYQRLLECSKDTLGSVHALLLRTIDYLDKLYTGQTQLDDGELSITYSSAEEQFQVYKHYFITEILEFHRVLMRFFKRDYDMSMQNIVYAEIVKRLRKLLLLFPRWKKALEFMETVYGVLSEEVYQTKRYLYNRKDIDNWGKVNIYARHGLCITSDNFAKFCKNISCPFKQDDLEEPFGLAHLNAIIADRLHDPFFKFMDVDAEKIRGKDVIFFFGNTGVGKTTLIQYLLNSRQASTVKHAANRYLSFTNINDIYYVDCQSLDEVRKSENEIQIWITIKTILNICKAVKFLKVTQVDDLKDDAKNYFRHCLQSCITFMRKYEKYSVGLGLIVTKMECLEYYSKHQTPEAKIRSILSQIAVDCSHDTKMVRFIELLLAKNGVDDSKMECFLSVTDNPKFKELFAHRQKRLEKMIEDISFVPSDQNDFNFVLSNKAKIQIFSIIMGNHLETYFHNSVSAPSCDIFNIDAAIESVVELLQAIRDEHLEFGDNCTTTVSDFLKNLFTDIQMDTAIIDETVDLVSSADGSAALSMITNIFKSRAQRRCIMFNYGFGAVENYMASVQKFTKLFTKLHEILSSYAVQSRKSEYQVVIATSTPSNDNCIDHLNFKLRLDQITGLDNFRDNDFHLVWDIHIRHIYQLLFFAISSNIQEVETCDEFRVKGNFLRTEKLTRETLTSTKPLFLYATNTIFIDQPVNKERRKVFVIAPTIELRISPSEIDTAFFITQNFIASGRSAGSLFGLYKPSRSDEMNLLYRYDVSSKTVPDDYIAFLMRNQTNTTFQEKKLWKFVDFIESEYELFMKAEHGGDYKLDKYQRTKSLIRHFQYLGTQACQSSDPKELVPRFRDLAKEVALQFTAEQFSRTVSSHLYVALTAKMHSLENDQSQQLILDAKQFLEALRTNIDQYNRASTANEIQRIQAEFKQSVRVKMAEGKTFIANQLVQKIDSLYATIDRNMEKLLAEVVSEQAKAEGIRQDLREKLETFRQTMTMRNIFATLRGVTTTLGAFGVITDKLAKVLDSSINVTEAIALPISRITEMPRYDLPHSVNDAIRMQDEKLEKIRNKDLDTLMDSLEDFFQVADKLPNKNDKIEAQINTMRKRLHEFKEEQQELHDSIKLLRACRIAKAAKELTKNLSNLIQPEQLKHMEILGRSFDNWTGRMHLIEEIHLVRENLLKVDEDLEKLQLYREKINTTMVPVLQDIQNAYNSCHKDLANLSEIGLDVKAWQMRSAFIQFRNFCAQFTAGFQMHGHMMDSLSQLEEGLNIHLTIQRRFHEYQNRQEIVEYFGRMSGATSSVSDDEVVNQLFSDLSMSINESIIIEQYNKGMNGFRQWAFPFGKVYLTDSSISNIGHDVCEPEQRLKSLTLQAIANVQHIIDRTMQHNSSVVSVRDSCVLECQFDGGNLMPTFCVWNSKDYRDDIKRILRGEEVQLTSYLQSAVRFDAVKFSKIRLEFSARDKDQQIAIDAYLKETTIRLVHSGKSYYKFGCNDFLITTEPVAIEYSYASQADGEPIIRNEVYNKLAQSKPVLSPYTEWRIQINGPLTSGLWKNAHVDLKLTGYGQYANVRIDQDLEVEKHYRQYICK